MVVPVLLLTDKMVNFSNHKLDETLELKSVFDNDGKDDIVLGLFSQIWHNHNMIFKYTNNI